MDINQKEGKGKNLQKATAVALSTSFFLKTDI